MEKIANILARKYPHFHTITPQSTVAQAIRQMQCENVDYLIVLDDKENFRGIISDHDIASKAIMKKKNLNKLKVSEVINSQLPMATTNDSVEHCMQLMLQYKTRHIAIFENFSFCGVVTGDDIIEEAVSHRHEIVDPGSVFVNFPG